MSDQQDKPNIEIEGNIVGSAVGDGNVTAKNIARGNIDITNVHGDQVAGDKVGGDKVLGDKIIHEAPKAPIKFPLYYIAPQKNRDFVGRVAELKRLHTTLDNGGIIPITQTIAGLGGVGKTQLAAEYAYRHLDAYELIYWLPANNSLMLTEAMATLAYRLEIAKREDNQPNIAAQAAKAWLENSQKRWLLIYDNADLPEMSPETLRRHVPTTGSGAVIITSRNDKWGKWKPLQLNVFTSEEAMAFLTGRLGAIATTDKDAAVTLADELGHLALALEHATAYMETHSKTVPAYLTLLRKRRQALWAKATPPADYQARTITTTWAIAMEVLSDEAAALLNLCAFLAPDEIPISMLTNGSDKLPSPLKAYTEDELQLDETLAALSRHALLTQQGDNLFMHRLVQAVVRDQMTPDLMHTWLGVAIELLADAYRFDPHDMSTWAQCGSLIPHMSVVTQLADDAQLDLPRLGYLNNEVGFYLDMFGDYEGAWPYYERALAIDEKALGAEHPDVARDLNNLGQLLQAMGEYEGARPYMERELAIFEAALGVNHPNTKIVRGNLELLMAEIERKQ